MTSTNPQADARPLLDRWADEHGRAVRGYLRTMSARDDVADDLWQEVFRRAWESRDRYREMGGARAYLMRIADRLLCDWSRLRHREVQIGDNVWEQIEPSSTD